MLQKCVAVAILFLNPKILATICTQKPQGLLQEASVLIVELGDRYFIEVMADNQLTGRFNLLSDMH